MWGDRGGCRLRWVSCSAGPVINSPASLFSRRSGDTASISGISCTSISSCATHAPMRARVYVCTCRGRRSVRSDLVNASGHISPFKRSRGCRSTENCAKILKGCDDTFRDQWNCMPLDLKFSKELLIAIWREELIKCKLFFHSNLLNVAKEFCLKFYVK